jgi:hypothetical protein
MLTIYPKLEDVPEALREHYEASGDKFVPKVSDDHPLVVKNRQLLNEKATAETKASGLETKVSGLTADLESAKATSLPRGHRAITSAVTSADAELLDKVEAHGTAEEVTSKLEEHKTFKQESDVRKRETGLREIAQLLGYDNVEAFVGLPDLPEFEKREKDGKKTVIVKVKEGESTVEKPAKEFLEASPRFAVYLPALITKPAALAPRVDPKAKGPAGEGEKDEKAKQAMAGTYANRW